MHTIVASHFLAGSLLTLLLPVGAARRGRPLLGRSDPPALGGARSGKTE